MPSNTDVVKLQSKDGEDFEVSFRAARLSKHIEDEINRKGTEEPIKLEKVSTALLTKIVKYLKHYEKEKMKKIIMHIKKFDISDYVQSYYADWVEEMEEDALFEMINVANDLKCMQMMTLCTAHTACLMKKVPMDTIQDIMQMMKGSDLETEKKIADGKAAKAAKK